MVVNRNRDFLVGLVREASRRRYESEWLEFKRNQSDPRGIGEYILALANSAALHGRPSGYLIWGIEDRTRAVVGTNFLPTRTSRGNEPLEAWLLKLLSPRADFKLYEISVSGRPAVLLEIDRM